MADDAQTGKTAFPAGFQPEAVARYWQHSAMRLMRANERILHGLVSAANREMELAQELARFNFSNLTRFPGPGQAANPGAETEMGLQAVQHIMAGLQEVSTDLWKTFGDASRLLLEGSLTETQDAVAETRRQAKAEMAAQAGRFAKTLEP